MSLFVKNIKAIFLTKIFAFCLFFSILNPLFAADSTRIAILGESFSDENNGLGVNQEVLERLFSVIKEKEPNAVIYTGNMTLGLQGSEEKKKVNAFVSQSGELADNTWPRDGFKYTTQNFVHQIENFLKIKNTFLGTNIPFYPLIARHEVFGVDSVDIVMKNFAIKVNSSFSENPLTYSFAIENSLFIVFSVAKYDAIKQGFDEKLSINLLKWIDLTLQRERSQYDYAFVVSNLPAFSTTASKGEFIGLDADRFHRDLFWSILKRNRVTAYFCSFEHLYDRSNRNGVWQIISGGAGAPYYKREFEKAFYHFVLLSIPKNTKTNPKIQVFDVQGNEVDLFELAPNQFPIYQLRIS